MKKRILALALLVAMLLSMLPGQVFAAQTETTTAEQAQESVQTPQEEVTTPVEETTEAEEATPAEEPSETEETTPVEETTVVEETQETEKPEYKNAVVLDESYPLTFVDEEYGPSFEPLMEAIAREGLAPKIICESAGTQAEDALAMKKCYMGILNS